jgi:predicted alpha/beta superfamily hydrolase
LLKQTLRPLIEKNETVLLIGHSLGSVIAYDTLWELSNQEGLHGKVDFLTIGSPLGMHYVQRRLMGMRENGKKTYPKLIRHWINLASEGDIIALERNFHNSFEDMLKQKLLMSIEDHSHGIFNYFRNEDGLNCHRSYGYLVNPAVGSIIADWWKHN